MIKLASEQAKHDTLAGDSLAWLVQSAPYDLSPREIATAIMGVVTPRMLHDQSSLLAAMGSRKRMGDGVLLSRMVAYAAGSESMMQSFRGLGIIQMCDLVRFMSTLDAETSPSCN